MLPSPIPQRVPEAPCLVPADLPLELPPGVGSPVLDAVLTAPPFAGRLSLHRVEECLASADAAVCIPACDEAERVEACLDAVRVALAAASVRGAVVVVVNNSRDATFELAAQSLRRSTLPYLICDVSFARGCAHAGNARRLAMDLGAALTPRGVLLTTDADSRVATDWIATTLRHTERTGGLVCGAIEVEEGEAALWNPSVREAARLETAMFRALSRLDEAADPEAGDDAGRIDRRGRPSGASLAMSAEAYRTVGGVPASPCGEDRALMQRFLDFDRPVVFASDVRVLTSCRRDGRAAGGFAATLAAWERVRDPFCDPALEPARAALLTALARRGLKAVRRGESPAALAGLLHVPAAAFWRDDDVPLASALSRLRSTSPVLRHDPMRLGTLRSELAKVHRLLAVIRTPPSDARLMRLSRACEGLTP